MMKLPISFGEKKLIKGTSSTLVSIPKAILSFWKADAGSFVDLWLEDDGKLVISPVEKDTKTGVKQK